MHTVLMGQGKLIYFLARQLISQGHTLTIICQDLEEATLLSRQFKAVVIHGDATNPNVLREAQIYQASLLLALTDRDEDNLVACQLAKQQYEIHQTLALVNDPDNQPLFQKLGVSVVISATEMIANLIQQQASFNDVQRITPVADGALNLLEVVLDEHSPVVGQALAELTTSSQVVGIQRYEQMVKIEPTVVFAAGDRIILICPASETGICLRALTGER